MLVKQDGGTIEHVRFSISLPTNSARIASLTSSILSTQT